MTCLRSYSFYRTYGPYSSPLPHDAVRQFVGLEEPGVELREPQHPAGGASYRGRCCQKTCPAETSDPRCRCGGHCWRWTKKLRVRCLYCGFYTFDLWLGIAKKILGIFIDGNQEEGVDLQPRTAIPEFHFGTILNKKTQLYGTKIQLSSLPMWMLQFSRSIQNKWRLVHCRKFIRLSHRFFRQCLV